MLFNYLMVDCMTTFQQTLVSCSRCKKGQNLSPTCSVLAVHPRGQGCWGTGEYWDSPAPPQLSLWGAQQGQPLPNTGMCFSCQMAAGQGSTWSLKGMNMRDRPPCVPTGTLSQTSQCCSAFIFKWNFSYPVSMKETVWSAVSRTRSICL